MEAMAFQMNGRRVFMLMIILLGIATNFAMADECTAVQRRCDRDTFRCKHKTFFADIYSGKICRGCNVCIKQGNPVDSKGCPQLPCPDVAGFTIATCRKPEVYNSWVMYHGRKCPTCEAMYCEIAFKRN